MRATTITALAISLLLASGVTQAQGGRPSEVAAVASGDALARGFQDPPAGARPRVWWHWMNGNITKEGIRLDLEWMDRIGIAGFQNFDVGLKTPQIVPQRLAYMTPEWRDAFRYATQLADRYGMEEGIAGSPGWSESGGPWVPPAQGMKKYVWSETVVEGGQPFKGMLAPLPAITGPFQDIPARHAPSGAAPPQFHADAVVVAYRLPPGDLSLASLHPAMSASAGAPDYAMLVDGKLATATHLPVSAVGQKAWIQYRFASPTAIRAVTLVSRGPDARFGIRAADTAVEASADGQHWLQVMAFPEGDGPEQTVSFPAVTAKYFRVTFERAAETSQTASAPQAGIASDNPEYAIAELVLHPGARVNHFEDKAGFTSEPDLYGWATAAVQSDQVIAKSDVIDLSAKMQADGHLDWTPPPGQWVVLRFGYSLLGVTNHPAAAEATGLEVDKLDHRYVRQYMEHYLHSYQQAVGRQMMGRRGINHVISDSWEAGSQNWTDAMIEQFQKRRGYSPIPWMPVLAGRIVESADASDKFLWDFRKTLSDLVADEHYGELQTVLNEWHMRHYVESHEGGRAFIADGMEVKKFSDVPMSAMWAQVPGSGQRLLNYNADDRESASVAHIYGQNIAAAESMTTRLMPWGWSPATLKPTADQEFLNGINRIFIHESAHQPLLGKQPGLSLDRYGQWFNRNETWANQARPWMDYLARSSFMLQQGHFGADVLYFYGEDSNITAIFRHKAPDVPEGYGFDYINADALIHVLHVEHGRILTPGGTAYRLLGLDPNSIHMSLPVLRALYRLVWAGATVAGPKPIDDPSLADDHHEFHRLCDELFGDGTNIRRVGEGWIYPGRTTAQALAAMKVIPDFAYAKNNKDMSIGFVHRVLEDGDVYFVSNRSALRVQTNATFRVIGKAPEFWHADTGRSEPASFAITDDHTTVPLELDAWEARFVVFRKPAMATSRVESTPAQTTLMTLSGPWSVAFLPGHGAPSSINLSALASWTEQPEPGVKYFSGTATYTHAIQAPSTWFRRRTRLWIDLGQVKELAEVQLNGKSLGIVWHAPYRLDATAALRPGRNALVVRVTNTWVNRLIGDQQAGAVPYTFTSVKTYQADSPLPASGLLGPVKLEAVTTRH